MREHRSGRKSTLRSERALRNAAILAAVVALLAAPAAPAAVDWDTYGFTVSRGGLNPHESTINPRNVHRLHQAWSFRLGSVIDTQPLFASQVPVPVAHKKVRMREDLVIAGSENGHLAAVDATTGRKVWLRRLGHVNFPSCPNLPHYGITGTPAIDPATNRIYVADGRGFVDQLDLSTGRTERSWRITRDPTHEHVWGALTVLSERVYVEIAGNCDTPPYHGRVVSIDTRSGSIRRWVVTGAANGGGIWGWAGISADPQMHALYAATGNSFAPPNEHAPYAERVVRLTLGLRVVASSYPGLPPTGDADFGATPLLYHAPGCPRQLAVGNKFGNFYVYDRAHIDSGPVQRIALGGSGFAQTALLGIGAYLPDQRLVYVANPKRHGRYGPGMLAFRVERDCRLALQWQAREPAGRTTDPTIAGGVVFYGTGGNGRVIAVDAKSGKRLWASSPHTIRGPVLNAPSVVNGVCYVGSWDGRLHAFKL
jgi:outer membrane protein assembly factor BamB